MAPPSSAGSHHADRGQVANTHAADRSPCPLPQVPITLTTLDVAEGMSLMQCVDPANFDIYTGRMAYSYCWRYACLPDVFATTRFKATCKELERWWVLARHRLGPPTCLLSLASLLELQTVTCCGTCLLGGLALTHGV